MYRLGQEMSRTRRTSVPFTLVVIDPDNRRLDAMTPQARVEAVRHFAAAVKETLRPEDVSARIGATTFGIILPDTPLDDGQQIVARLRLAHQAAGTTPDGATSVPPAVGIVEYRGERINQGALLEGARRSMRDVDRPPVGKTQPASR